MVARVQEHCFEKSNATTSTASCSFPLRDSPCDSNSGFHVSVVDRCQRGRVLARKTTPRTATYASPSNLATSTVYSSVFSPSGDLWRWIRQAKVFPRVQTSFPNVQFSVNSATNKPLKSVTFPIRSTTEFSWQRVHTKWWVKTLPFIIPSFVLYGCLHWTRGWFVSRKARWRRNNRIGGRKNGRLELSWRTTDRILANEKQHVGGLALEKPDAIPAPCETLILGLWVSGYSSSVGGGERKMERPRAKVTRSWKEKSATWKRESAK